jgi:hypothetical protein
MPGGGGTGGSAMDPEALMALQRSHQAVDELEERGMAMLGVCVCGRWVRRGAELGLRVEG